jgi:hypothetical protein
MDRAPPAPGSRCQLTVPVPSSEAVGAGNDSAALVPFPSSRGTPSTSFFSSIPLTPAGPCSAAANVPRPPPLNARRGCVAPAPTPNASSSTGAGASSNAEASMRRPRAREVNPAPSLNS